VDSTDSWLTAVGDVPGAESAVALSAYPRSGSPFMIRLSHLV